MPTLPKDYDPVASIRYGHEDVRGSLEPGNWSYTIPEIEKRAKMAHRSHTKDEESPGEWTSCMNQLCEQWQRVYDLTPSIRTR